MKLTITINMDGAAFQDGGGVGYEVARILREYADDAESSGGVLFGESLLDVNGNTCGSVKLSGKQ